MPVHPLCVSQLESESSIPINRVKDRGGMREALMRATVLCGLRLVKGTLAQRECMEIGWNL